MPPTDPTTFARQWAANWNARDVEGVLSHFAEDVVFTSPLALRLDPESGGVVRGKEALRAYWTAGLEMNANLKFEVISVFVGVDSLLIGFRNEAGEDRVEVLRFRDGLVCEGHGTYGVKG